MARAGPGAREPSGILEAVAGEHTPPMAVPALWLRKVPQPLEENR